MLSRLSTISIFKKITLSDTLVGRNRHFGHFFFPLNLGGFVSHLWWQQKIVDSGVAFDYFPSFLRETSRSDI